MNREKKNKHMRLEDRIEIQECLSKGMSFNAIAKRIEKDATTVSREVKARSVQYRNSYSTSEEPCPLLLKAPFVCNACSKRSYASCHFVRRVYKAQPAQQEYETTLVESREGIPLNKEAFYQMDVLLTRAVRNGQSVYHAIHANKLSTSKSSVYRYIRKGYCTCAAIDLPRAVKFKPRAKHAELYVPRGIRIGRTYQDFQDFISLNPFTRIVEMDTVIGRPGGKVLMTFQVVNEDFMFALLLDNKSAGEAANKITVLKEQLAAAGYSFGDLFPVLLTDNGGEFSYVSAFENTPSGSKETSVFFCDPNAPYQKPHVENNHTLLRSILPAGSSFDHLSQQDVNIIFSHVNSMLRSQFRGKSSFDMFSFTYSSHIANTLGVSFVPPQDVILSPLLLKSFSR